MAAPVPSLEHEVAAWTSAQLLVGVDEVGRGPLAGPVVAAAVVFPAGCARIRGLRDSKLLPPDRRSELAGEVRRRALALGIGAASTREIDRLNIRVATAVAMRRALRALFRRMPLVPVPAEGRACPPAAGAARRDRRRRAEFAAFAPSACRVLLDGLPLPEVGVPHEALVDGDAHCMSIAAAGVVAKTVRDELMGRLARRYPRYGWETNMGYGTPVHHDGLRAHGPCAHHRQSFAPIAQLELL
jgi:ribonuclease HII